MRLALTVVSPASRPGANRAAANVVLDADPETRVGDVAAELAGQAGFSGAPAEGDRDEAGAQPTAGDRWVAGAAAAAGARVAAQPAAAGNRVSAASAGDEPTG